MRGGDEVSGTGIPTVASVRSGAVMVSRVAERQAYRYVARWPRRVRCPVCGWSGARFAPSARPRTRNRICPSCRSSERDRAVALALESLGPAAPGARLLEIAPIGVVEPLATRLGYAYASLDRSSPRAEVLGDLTALPFPDERFDVVICLHVLEHVPDDAAAVRELARVAAPGGRCLVVVPWDPARPATFEDATDDPAEYERYYGQSDHVRIYGADVVERWRRAGVSVEEELWTDRFGPRVHRAAALTGKDDRFWFLS